MFKNSYKGKKVLVTGNTGFKGSWLSIWLAELGAEVYGLSNGVPTHPSMFEKLELKSFVRYSEGDVRNLEFVTKQIGAIAPDFIFHLAAQPIVGTSYTDPVGTIATNAMGTVNILEAVRQLNNPCHVLLITSDKCYENVEWIYGYRETDRLGGKDIYSASKAAAEILLYSYYHSFIKNLPHIRMASVRAGNVIGGGDWAEKRLVPDCIRSWSQGKPVVIRNPQSTRPWQHVLEPISGYLVTGQELAATDRFNGESFNFGPAADQVFSVQEILKAIGRHWSQDRNGDLFQVEANPGFHEAGLLKLNCDKASTHLKWQAVLSFNETAKFTAAWYLAYYQEHGDMLRLTRQQINDYVNLAKEKELPWASV